MIDMSDSRRKREARLRRCLEETPQVEAVIAENFESADYDYYDATNGPRIVSGDRPLGNTTRDKIKAPKISLRSFFPETWLFTLDTVNEDTDISR